MPRRFGAGHGGLHRDLDRAAVTAPHHIKKLNRDSFLEWLEANGATILEPTNPYEVIRYRKWCDGDKARPSTHIIYKRNDGSLTYQGQSRAHYESAIS